ncbi:flavin reductase family protein [Bacillus thermotolerans]|uniref:Nitrilotriacetate monooxygenase component B n=1 Tax=Bacillus thermotolerans TaxID=1221996 RepID=A0A0F5I7Y6_BACTR|nr:flavin reductase family protein [Bacillus thermotolerans]KKB34249.1 Nitrilotriacetate monooxygenase component B [Bacillus thermotolerans]KKB41744.1 Nitrilotriacetate monooxygenase component B [Bacillus thermotolerans]KKB44364.1 Nitrilotriacetate monooxygenase component B [Bacillus thermotolerans]
MDKAEKQAVFKEVMGNYPTGVTVVTGVTEDGTPVGLTVNSFASVSLDPLMVLWSIDHGVSTIKAFTEGGKFAVHVLAGDQKDLCMTFATKGVDRFSQCKWEMSENGLPIIEGAFGVFECETFKAVEAGDHTVLIGNVKDIQIDKSKDPMLYHRRAFGPIPAEFYTDK